MKDSVIAQITWLTHNEGGRKNIPSKGASYYPNVRLNIDKKETMLSLAFVCTDVDEKNQSIVDLSFLCPEFSAKKILKSGMNICIYEGSKKVAKAVIL